MRNGLLAPRTVQPLAHFLAGLEVRDDLLVDAYLRAGARIAAHARRPALGGEGAEAAQLDAVAAGERGGDLVQHGVDDVLDVALIKMRIRFRDPLYELRLDHAVRRPQRKM